MIACELFNEVDEECDLTKLVKSSDSDESELTVLSWKMYLQVKPSELVHSPESAAFANNMRMAFAPQFHEDDKEFPSIHLPISLKLEVDKTTDLNYKYKSRLLVFGDLLEAMALHCSTSVRLRIFIGLSNSGDSNADHDNFIYFSHQTDDMDIYFDMLPVMSGLDRVVTGFCQHSFSLLSIISCLWEGKCDNPWQVHAVGVLVDHQTKDVARLEKLLTSKHNDVTLVANDGQEIRASKILLEASSDVFAKAFEQGWKECDSHRYHMSAESPEAIKAFLEFIYVNNIDKAEANLSLAIEVLELAHKYNVTALEKAMKEMFQKKHESWIGTGNAVKLFRFVRNVEGYKALKMKAVRVIIKGTLMELQELVEFDGPIQRRL